MRGFIISLLLILVIGTGGFCYFIFISPNIQGKRAVVKIPTGSTYKDVIQILRENQVLKNELSFAVVSKMKKYPTRIMPGYYVFTGNMNNRQIVNMLRAGLQVPVTLIIYNIRTKEEFAGLVGRTLEMDSLSLLKKLNDVTFCKWDFFFNKKIH